MNTPPPDNPIAADHPLDLTTLSPDVREAAEHGLESNIANLDEHRRQRDPNALVSIGVKEMLSKQYPVREQYLGPILRKKDLMMLHAYRGIGKTHTAMSLAWAVATGTSFLKWTSAKPKRVLYLDGEMDALEVQGRFQNLAETTGAIPEEGFFNIVTPDEQEGAPLNVSTEEGQNRLGKMTADHDLIILDSLLTTTNAGSDNEGKEWPMVQEWLLRMRRQGKTVIVVHHGGKSGAQLGSVTKETVMNTVVKLSRPKDYRQEQGARFIWEFEKCRSLTGKDAEPFEAQLVDDGRSSRWSFKESEELSVDRVAFMLNQGASIRQIAAELGLTKSQVETKKKKAFNTGKLDNLDD